MRKNTLVGCLRLPRGIYMFITNLIIIFKHLFLCNRLANQYKVYINDGPELTLANFNMSMQNLAKLFCTYSRPRYQVSVYRTIGPLVLFFLLMVVFCVIHNCFPVVEILTSSRENPSSGFPTRSDIYCAVQPQ